MRGDREPSVQGELFQNVPDVGLHGVARDAELLREQRNSQRAAIILLIRGLADV